MAQNIEKSGAFVYICPTRFGTLLQLIKFGAKEVSDLPAKFVNDITEENLERHAYPVDSSCWMFGLKRYRADLQTTRGRGSAQGMRQWNQDIDNFLKYSGERLIAHLDALLEEASIAPGSTILVSAPGYMSSTPLTHGYLANGQPFSEKWDVRLRAAPLRYFIQRNDDTSRLKAHASIIADPDIVDLRHYGHKGDSEDFTKDSVLKRMSDATCLYLICHGLWNPTDPDKSGLKLADGVLSLRDIMRAQLSKAPNLFLGACETGILDGLQMPYEGQGLAVGLLEAGARNVIAPLWPIMNVSARSLCLALYEKPENDFVTRAYAILRSMREGGVRSSSAEDDGFAAIATLIDKEGIALPERDWQFPKKSHGGDWGSKSEEEARYALLHDLSQPFHWAAWAVHTGAGPP